MAEDKLRDTPELDQRGDPLHCRPIHETGKLREDHRSRQHVNPGGNPGMRETRGPLNASKARSFRPDTTGDYTIRLNYKRLLNNP
jgi:hypothetical protein